MSNHCHNVRSSLQRHLPLVAGVVPERISCRLYAVGSRYQRALYADLLLRSGADVASTWNGECPWPFHGSPTCPLRRL